MIDFKRDSLHIATYRDEQMKPIKSIEVLPKKKGEKDYFVFQHRPSNQAYQTLSKENSNQPSPVCSLLQEQSQEGMMYTKYQKQLNQNKKSLAAKLKKKKSEESRPQTSSRGQSKSVQETYDLAPSQLNAQYRDNSFSVQALVPQNFIERQKEKVQKAKQIQKLFKGMNIKSLKFDSCEDPAVTYSNYLQFPMRDSKRESIAKKNTSMQSSAIKSQMTSREEKVNPFNDKQYESA